MKAHAKTRKIRHKKYLTERKMRNYNAKNTVNFSLASCAFFLPFSLCVQFEILSTKRQLNIKNIEKCKSFSFFFNNCCFCCWNCFAKRKTNKQKFTLLEKINCRTRNCHFSCGKLLCFSCVFCRTPKQNNRQWLKVRKRMEECEWKFTNNKK